MKTPISDQSGFSIVEVLVATAIGVIGAVVLSNYAVDASRSTAALKESVEASTQASLMTTYLLKKDTCHELGILSKTGYRRMPDTTVLCNYGALKDSGKCAASASPDLSCSNDSKGICSDPYPFRGSMSIPGVSAMGGKLASATFSMEPGAVRDLTQQGDAAPRYAVDLKVSFERTRGGPVSYTFPFLISLRGAENGLPRALPGDIAGVAKNTDDIVSCSFAGGAGAGVAGSGKKELCEVLGFRFDEAEGECSPQAEVASGEIMKFAARKLADPDAMNAYRSIKQNRVIGCQSGKDVIPCKRELVPGEEGTCFYLTSNGKAPGAAGVVPATFAGKKVPDMYFVDEGWRIGGKTCTGVYYVDQGVDPDEVSLPATSVGEPTADEEVDQFSTDNLSDDDAGGQSAENGEDDDEEDGTTATL